MENPRTKCEFLKYEIRKSLFMACNAPPTPPTKILPQNSTLPVLKLFNPSVLRHFTPLQLETKNMKM